MLSLQRLFYQYRASPILKTAWRHSRAYSSADFQKGEFLAVDLEMSGLDHKRCEIVSGGWIAVSSGRVQLGSAEHHYVLDKGLKHNPGVGDSAAIHQVRDCDREAGIPPEMFMQKLVAAASSKTLIFHNASLDIAFLNKAAKERFKAPLLLPFIDTMELERKRLIRRQGFVRPGELRLHACRDRYHLPQYPAHNALVDALATAELFLAQTNQL